MGQPAKTLTDSKGLEWPIEYMDPDIVTRTQLVESLYEEAFKYRTLLKSFKQKVRENVKQYLNTVASKYGESWKGNTMITNFSQTVAIEVYINEFLVFDEKLQIAKSKIDSCIRSWSKGSDEKIALLVEDAFQVDKKGNVNSKRILGLRQYKFQDKLWLEAMDLITDSVTVSSTKQYINFKKKDSEGKWQTISMNWSNL